MQNYLKTRLFIENIPSKQGNIPKKTENKPTLYTFLT